MTGPARVRNSHELWAGKTMSVRITYKPRGISLGRKEERDFDADRFEITTTGQIELYREEGWVGVVEAGVWEAVIVADDSPRSASRRWPHLPGRAGTTTHTPSSESASDSDE